MIVEGKPFDESLVMTPEEEKVFDVINDADSAICVLIGRVRSLVPPSREVSLAVTKLEEACMWLNKAPLS